MPTPSRRFSDVGGHARRAARGPAVGRAEAEVAAVGIAVVAAELRRAARARDARRQDSRGAVIRIIGHHDIIGVGVGPMRYILSLALLLSACTRANPDAVGGNGGGVGGHAAVAERRRRGGGGGGSGGGGGAAGGVDLAMSMPHDMAMRPDMATLDGVACGQASCINGEDCCISNNGEKCTNTQQCSGGSHPTLWACDGPEDCKSSVDGQCCANTSGSACDPTCGAVGGTPMCHSLADCPTLGGYLGCCAVPQLMQYKVCSKQACPLPMRTLLCIVILAGACTRANPDAVGGGGGNGGGGGGSAGSGGGGGGSAGGGGTGGGDMSGDQPKDMSMTGPADMTSFSGVYCGNNICMAPTNECCASANTLTCIPPAQLCNGNAYDCDGPEDCKTGQTCCGGGTGSTCNDLAGGSCASGRAPLCHTLDECPKSNGGFAGCCASPQGGHIRFCSKMACP